MNSANFPPVDDAIKFLSNVDYKKLISQVVTFIATVCAIVVGVVSYISFSVQYWYEDGGKQKIVNAYEFVKTNANRVIDFVNTEYIK